MIIHHHQPFACNIDILITNQCFLYRLNSNQWSILITSQRMLYRLNSKPSASSIRVLWLSKIFEQLKICRRGWLLQQGKGYRGFVDCGSVGGLPLGIKKWNAMNLDVAINYKRQEPFFLVVLNHCCELVSDHENRLQNYKKKVFDDDPKDAHERNIRCWHLIDVVVIWTPCWVITIGNVRFYPLYFDIE